MVPIVPIEIREENFVPVLQFVPLLKRLRWGGERLGTVLGKSIGPEGDYAESWEIADHGVDQSVVIGGAYAGWTLGRLAREAGADLWGSHRGAGQFPLLIKYLDAQDRLSVQVHPDDAQARVHDPAGNGKTEAWVIIRAEPGSRVYAGLRHGVDRARLEDALARNSVESCLHTIPVRPGDCIFVPAGTVHAIGEGVLLAEVQQSCDITFRLDDWGRTGPDGKPRALHVSQALDCIDFARGPLDPAKPVVVSSGDPLVEELVRSPYFVIRRHRARRPFPFGSPDGFRIVVVLDGEATCLAGDCEESLRIGATRLLLPGAASRIIPRDTVTLLEVYLP